MVSAPAIVMILAATPAPFDVLELWRGAAVSIDWGRDADLQSDVIRTATARVLGAPTRETVVQELVAAARTLSGPVVAGIGRPAGTLLRFDASGAMRETAVSLSVANAQQDGRLIIFVPKKAGEALRQKLGQAMGERAPVLHPAKQSEEWVLETPPRFDSLAQLKKVAPLLAPYGKGTFLVDEPLASVELAAGKARVTALEHTAADREDARTFARLLAAPRGGVVTSADLALDDDAPFALPLWLPEELWLSLEARAYEQDTSLSRVVQACLDAPAPDAGGKPGRRWTGPMLVQRLFVKGRHVRQLERSGLQRSVTASQLVSECVGSL